MGLHDPKHLCSVHRLWKLTKKLKVDSQKAIQIITDLTLEFIEYDDADRVPSKEARQKKEEQVEAKNRLESFLDLHKPEPNHGHPQHEESLQSLQPGKLLVHFKRFF
jgi:hypothetical protein